MRSMVERALDTESGLASASGSASHGLMTLDKSLSISESSAKYDKQDNACESNLHKTAGGKK